MPKELWNKAECLVIQKIWNNLEKQDKFYIEYKNLIKLKEYLIQQEQNNSEEVQR